MCETCELCTAGVLFRQPAIRELAQATLSRVQAAGGHECRQRVPLQPLPHCYQLHPFQPLHPLHDQTYAAANNNDYTALEMTAPIASEKTPLLAAARPGQHSHARLYAAGVSMLALAAAAACYIAVTGAPSDVLSQIPFEGEGTCGAAGQCMAGVETVMAGVETVTHHAGGKECCPSWPQLEF